MEKNGPIYILADFVYIRHIYTYTSMYYKHVYIYLDV